MQDRPAGCAWTSARFRVPAVSSFHRTLSVPALLAVAMVAVGCSGQTDPPTEVAHASARFQAHGDCGSARGTGESWFEYREAGRAGWQSTGRQSFTCRGRNERIAASLVQGGLKPLTRYEIRATGTFNAAGPYPQNIRTFQTLAAPGPAAVAWGLSANAVTGELDSARAAGVSLIRQEFSGTFAQEGSDAAVRAIAQRGMTVLPMLQQTVNLQQANVQSFAGHVRAYTARYGPGGSFWQANPDLDPQLAPRVFELYNEPYGTWYGPVLPAKFVQLQQAAVREGRQGCPSCRFTLAIERTPDGDSGPRDTWIADLFAAGLGAGDFDLLAQHPYSHGRSPARGAADQWGFHRLDVARRELLARGIDKPVWITEIGWSTGTPGTTEQLRAQWYRETADLVRARPWVQAVVFYHLAGRDDGTEEGEFGIAQRPALSPTPAYQELQRITSSRP
jgi:hypothetical protein